MALNQEESSLVQEAIQVYLQIVARQMPQEHVTKIAQIAESALKKISTLDSGNNSGGIPEGITDEWYTNVCKTCSKLSPTGCTDKVTEKYPGKCDPILHYEQNKLSS